MKHNLISHGRGLMTESCWLLLSFLNEMVNTSFQVERLLISSRAGAAIPHSNHFPSLPSTLDRIRRIMKSIEGFLDTSLSLLFFLLLSSLFCVSAPSKLTGAVSLGHAISASTLETSGRSFWCSCRCLQYLWILD